MHDRDGMWIDDGTRSRLMSRQRELLGRYVHELELADEEIEGREIERIGHASEQWSARVQLQIGESDARALTQIVDAIRRIDAGTYGTCVTCGKRIAALRLKVLPAAASCVRCASRAELATASW
jgi:RNA polymerase-binding transcription factor DksA